MERSQSEGAFVDLRNVLQAGRASNGGINLTLQVVNVTGGPPRSKTVPAFAPVGT